MAAVCGAVKLSLDKEVWTLSSARGEALYNELARDVLNGTVVYKQKLPSAEVLQADVGARWNGQVNSAFGWLDRLPETLKQRLNDAYKKTVS